MIKPIMESLRIYPESSEKKLSKMERSSFKITRESIQILLKSLIKKQDALDTVLSKSTKTMSLEEILKLNRGEGTW